MSANEIGIVSDNNEPHQSKKNFHGSIEAKHRRQSLFTQRCKNPGRLFRGQQSAYTTNPKFPFLILLTIASTPAGLSNGKFEPGV
jgi:hypothetical protein